MKKPALTRYNMKNARLSHGLSVKDPVLSMRDIGSFRLNKALMELIGARVGDRVELLHDTNAKEWYLAFNKADGFELRKATNGGALFASVILRNAIVEDIGPVKKSNSWVVAKTPTEAETDNGKAWAILTSTAEQP
ncbi:MAG TPA: hypothetical protein PLB89_04985 [Flavobacteriales bacterium]|nr:hypothetical protein [Flavobacteriales bacterium]